MALAFVQDPRPFQFNSEAKLRSRGTNPFMDASSHGLPAERGRHGVLPINGCAHGLSPDPTACLQKRRRLLPPLRAQRRCLFQRFRHGLRCRAGSGGTCRSPKKMGGRGRAWRSGEPVCCAWSGGLPGLEPRGGGRVGRRRTWVWVLRVWGR
jgi:hypothetical protein